MIFESVNWTVQPYETKGGGYKMSPQLHVWPSYTVCSLMVSLSETLEIEKQVNE